MLMGPMHSMSGSFCSQIVLIVWIMHFFFCYKVLPIIAFIIRHCLYSLYFGKYFDTSKVLNV